MSRHHSEAPEQTEALGAGLAATLRPGDVVLVEGELGAGKTTFVRGACRALGVTSVVHSPTFTIGQRYAGAVPVSHIDLYRVADLDAEDPELLADYLTEDRVAFVEWPPEQEGEIARFARVSARVRIEHDKGERRWVIIERDGGERRWPRTR